MKDYICIYKLKINLNFQFETAFRISVFECQNFIFNYKNPKFSHTMISIKNHKNNICALIMKTFLFF